MNEGPITREEMITLFGEEIPMEAVALIWNEPEGMTIGQIRAKLREIARCHCGRNGHPLNSVNCPVHGYSTVPAQDMKTVTRALQKSRDVLELYAPDDRSGMTLSALNDVDRALASLTTGQRSTRDTAGDHA